MKKPNWNGNGVLSIIAQNKTKQNKNQGNAVRIKYLHGF